MTTNSKHYSIWPESDLELLRREYPTANTRALAEKFGRSPSSVRKRAEKLGLRKEEGLDYRNKWRFKKDDQETFDESASLQSGADKTRTETGVKMVVGNVTTHRLRG